MGVFDDIIGSVAAEDRAVLDKYPALKTSMETLETRAAQAEQYAGEWVGWQKQNWDAEAGMTKAERALRDELAAAQARLETAQAAGSGASAATVDKLAKDFDAKLAAVRTESERAIQGMTQFYNATQSRMLKHQAEFGETLDPAALLNFMQTNRINDPETAYDKMFAPKRAELATARQKELDEKHQQEIQAAEQRGREAQAKEQAMGPAGMLPTDSTGGIAGVTARIDKPAAISDEVKARIAEAKPGDGTLAQLGYEMYRRGELPVQ